MTNANEGLELAKNLKANKEYPPSVPSIDHCVNWACAKKAAKRLAKKENGVIENVNEWRPIAHEIHRLMQENAQR